MIQPSDSPIIAVVSRALAPFIQVFALYVVFHGHYGPGGGFQGGAMFAASLILLRLSLGGSVAGNQFRSSWATPIGAVGVFLFAGVGIVALAFGGEYLNYAFLPFGLEQASLRSFGILLIEISVAVALVGTLVAIFDDLVEGHEHD
ncbi:MAG: sodium:proton antiporter [Ignavibacteriales bacterium]|jgi:multicomponent Na+:H+ antiporter subunit B|nr:sodium:proton antiporter [Ignavibacteriales bacterium]